MNKFAEWMKNNDRKQLPVSEKLGISQSFLHGLLRKGFMPSLKVAYEIEKYTQGDVTVYDWLDYKEKSTAETKLKPSIKEKKTK